MYNFFIAILAVVASVFSCGKGTKSDSKVLSYEYSHNGTVAQPLAQFKVEKLDDDSCLVTYYNHYKELSHDEYGNYKLDKSKQPIELLDSISMIVKEHKMRKYKKDYKPILDVLDGDSWHLDIQFEDSTSISSHGYCAGPGDDGMTIILRMLRDRIEGL